jgi:hypothetical protein
LDASFLSQITSIACTDYLISFTNTRRLALNGCDKISRKAVNQLIAHLPKLETLEVRWIPFKAPKRQASPLFASPLRSSSHLANLTVSYVPLSTESIPRFSSLLIHANLKYQLEGVIALRKLLYFGEGAPSKEVVENGLIPKLVYHLVNKDPLMQLEATWALSSKVFTTYI